MQALSAPGSGSLNGSHLVLSPTNQTLREVLKLQTSAAPHRTKLDLSKMSSIPEEYNFITKSSRRQPLSPEAS
jgi:hypothetical protein